MESSYRRSIAVYRLDRYECVALGCCFNKGRIRSVVSRLDGLPSMDTLHTAALFFCSIVVMSRARALINEVGNQYAKDTIWHNLSIAETHREAPALKSRQSKEGPATETSWARNRRRKCDLLQLGHASGRTYEDSEVYTKSSNKVVTNWQDVQPLTVCITTLLSSVDHGFGGGLNLSRPRCGETVSLHAFT